MTNMSSKRRDVSAELEPATVELTKVSGRIAAYWFSVQFVGSAKQNKADCASLLYQKKKMKRKESSYFNKGQTSLRVNLIDVFVRKNIQKEFRLRVLVC